MRLEYFGAWQRYSEIAKRISLPDRVAPLQYTSVYDKYMKLLTQI